MTDLRAIRQQLGLTQAEFAHVLGYLNQPAYARAERDGGSEQTRRLAKMLATHGVPDEWKPPR